MNYVDVRAYLMIVPVDFRIALARIRFSSHIVVEIRMDGLCGVGEGVVYRSSPMKIRSAFAERVMPLFRADYSRGESPKAELGWLRSLAEVSPCLAHAVDSALCDLQGKLAGEPVAGLLGGIRRSRLEITEQVFVHDWPTTARKIEAILARGTRRIKVKIGMGCERDARMMRHVRDLVGPAVSLQVDANHAYTDVSQVAGLCRALEDIGVEAIEEPLAIKDWSSLGALRSQTRLPIMLDESILCEHDLQQAIAAKALDALNIKLSRVGGLRLALDYARACQEQGIAVGLGCAEDLGVSTAAIVHLAAALPEVFDTEGLGPERLGFDIVTRPWAIDKGEIVLPPGSGLGVELDAQWRQRLPRHVRSYDLGRAGWDLRAFSSYMRIWQRANNVLWRVFGR
jgi:L-alanine-DL-glutamate epimerase-like enolase superfamily enzyme